MEKIKEGTKNAFSAFVSAWRNIEAEVGSTSDSLFDGCAKSVKPTATKLNNFTNAIINLRSLEVASKAQAVKKFYAVGPLHLRGITNDLEEKCASVG
jgi:hypothetical protein